MKLQVICSRSYSSCDQQTKSPSHHGGQLLIQFAMHPLSLLIYHVSSQLYLLKFENELVELLL